MRYALIDNSTLTGIQRLLGEIPVKNIAIVDNDIIAFENYIQAILFYDNLICIDDYKPAYRSTRLQTFPDIRLIPASYFDYDDFINLSSEITKDIVLEIKGGRISDDDFKEYFDKLQMTFRFTWDMSGSSFYLTQKMLLPNKHLSVEQFSKLHALLFKENNEQYEVKAMFENKVPKLYDSKGKVISTNKEISGRGADDNLSPQFKALASSLNWLSQRTAFYVLAADYLYADLFIHPIRQSFLESIIKRTHPSYDLGVFRNFFNCINSKSETSLKKILEASENFGLSVDIPLFSAYFAKKTGNSKQIIEAAYNEKEKSHFKNARNKLSELNSLLDNNQRVKYVREINLLKSDIEKTFKSIESKYGLGDKQGVGIKEFKFLFSSIPILKHFSLPQGLDVRIKKLEFMKHILPRKGFNAVYTNVIEELLEFEKIGKYKDILVGNVKYDKDAIFWDIKTEQFQYMNASSYWKKPM